MEENKSEIKKSAYIIVGLLLIALCAITILKAGIIGKFFYDLIYFFIGQFSYVFLVAMLILIIIYVVKKHLIDNLVLYAFLLLLFDFYFLYSIIYYIMNTSELSDIGLYTTSNIISTPGNLGLYINKIGFLLFDFVGSIILLLVLIIITVYIIFKETQLHKKVVTDKFQEALTRKLSENTEELEYTRTLIDTSNLDDKDLFSYLESATQESIDEVQEVEIIPKSVIKPNETVALEYFDEIFSNVESSEKISSNSNFGETIALNKNEETKVSQNRSKYLIPDSNILKSSIDNEDTLVKLRTSAENKGKILIETLQSFKLNAKITNIIIGPAVTKYEILPEVGTKVNKFNSLSNDIAFSLAAKDVRIEAPIPGKSAVGIEVPNDKVMMVSLKEVFNDKRNSKKDKLKVALGKDINGNPSFLDISKAPHILVAGSTGSGKSVCINTIIVSILLKATPDEVKLVMIDPKKVELTPYNDVAHLLTPVVTDPKKANVVLAKMVAEMEQRYELFSKTNTRNIDSYNKKVKTSEDLTFKELPYIVIIVDELADLMMVASNEVETSIARIAQMARAAGIHLILATQRPSTDVITGLIKTNIPTRIAFSVSSGIDSRTILDQVGAEKLLGKGDMFLSEAGTSGLKRIQGAFLSDEEISEVVNNISSQFSPEELQENFSDEFDDSKLAEFNETQSKDELYEEVKTDVIQMQKASASFIQRKYKVGYNRACKILDQLEEGGVISPNEGPKARKVLINEEDS